MCKSKKISADIVEEIDNGEITSKHYYYFFNQLLSWFDNHNEYDQQARLARHERVQKYSRIFFFHPCITISLNIGCTLKWQLVKINTNTASLNIIN